MDTTRSCYEAWMRVPEAADPIRIRWYAVPRPPAGSYELTDYSSSDWDDDPKSNDPALGEQSTTRNPWTDWRDCSPPPWQVGCAACANRQLSPLFVTMLVTGIDHAIIVHVTLVYQGGSTCRWTGTYHYFHGNPPVQLLGFATLTYDSPNHQTFVGGAGNTLVLEHVGPWTCRQNLTVTDGTDSLTITTGSDVALGCMYLWPGDLSSIPPDHLICDGSAIDPIAFPLLFNLFPSGNLPDMRKVFVAGADPSDSNYVQGAAGGQDQVTLTAAQMPAHGHTVTDPGHGHGVTDPGHTHTFTGTAHTHTVTDPGHTHTLTDPGHTHDVDCRSTPGSPIVAPAGASASGTVTTVAGCAKSKVSGITQASAVTGVSNQNATAGGSNAAAATGVTVANAATGISLGNTGGGGSHENRPHFVAFTWIIKAK